MGGGTGFNLSIWVFKSKFSMVWDKVADSSRDRKSPPPL